jgi:hypothetical protein
MLAGPGVALGGLNMWTTNGPVGGGVTSLAIVPGTPATLYAGTCATPANGVFKSIDGGATWTAANNGLSNLCVVALAIAPTPTTLYAGTVPNCDIYGTCTGGDVYRSTDSGGSWSALNSFPSDGWGSEIPPINALAIDPTTPSTLYAGSDEGNGSRTSLWKSTNGGGTWVEAGTWMGPFVLFPSVNALAIDPTTPTTLYAGTDSTVPNISGAAPTLFQSTDGGSTWGGISGSWVTDVTSLAIDPTTPTTLYAGTDDLDLSNDTYVSSGIQKSTDGGADWTNVKSTTATQYISGYSALAIDPSTPTTVYAGSNNLQTGKLGTTGQAVLRSIDGGQTWAALNNGLTTFYAHNVWALAVDPTTPSIVYAATDDGVFDIELPADAVVLAPSPLAITIPKGATEVDKTLKVTVRNAGWSAGTIQLAIGTSCPAGSVGTADFGNGQNSILVAAGETAKATVPLTIQSGAFTSFNFKAPTRCPLVLTASLVVGGTDPNPSNNQAIVELNVVNKNYPQETARHETTITSAAPTAITIAQKAATGAKKLTAVVGNADYLPKPETPGDAITLQASTSCSGLTLSTPVCDSTTGSATVTVKGGATKTCKFTATAAAAQISTPNKLSPQRCTVTLTATGPSYPEASPLDPSNDTTQLTIDITDKNDF